jgi:agmatinase
VAYHDAAINQRLYAGQNWVAIYQEIISHLPQQVHISFDVDGLDPKLCPLPAPQSRVV